MKKKKEAQIFAEDVAKKNQIWQHRISGEKYVVIKVNKFSVKLLSTLFSHTVDPSFGRDNSITVSVHDLTHEYTKKYTMVTA